MESSSSADLVRRLFLAIVWASLIFTSSAQLLPEDEGT
ncbi:hypothetical protein OROHE_022306 [Orobanche hederae]